MDSVFLSPFAVPFAAPMPTPSGIGAAIPFVPTMMSDVDALTPPPAAMPLAAMALAPAMFVSSAMAEMPPVAPALTAPAAEPVASDSSVDVALADIPPAPTPRIGPEAAIDTLPPVVASVPSIAQVAAPVPVPPATDAPSTVSPDPADRPQASAPDPDTQGATVEQQPVNQPMLTQPDPMPATRQVGKRGAVPAPATDTPAMATATLQVRTSPDHPANPASLDDQPIFETGGDDDSAAMRAAPEESSSPAAAPPQPAAPAIPQAAPPSSPASGTTVIVTTAPEIAIDAAPAAVAANQPASGAQPRSERRKASGNAASLLDRSPVDAAVPTDAIVTPVPQSLVPAAPKPLAVDPAAKDSAREAGTTPAAVASTGHPGTPDTPHVADRPSETVTSAPSPAAGTASPATFAPTQSISTNTSPRQTAQPEPVVVAGQPGRIGHETGVAIARHAVEGVDTVAIRLDPGDMGRIEVRLSFEEGGTLRAVVAADNPASLDLLRRDTAQLVRALGDAGIATDAGSFRFDTRSDDRGGNGGGWQRQPQASPYARDDATENQPDASEPYRRMTTRGRVEIMA